MHCDCKMRLSSNVAVATFLASTIIVICVHRSESVRLIVERREKFQVPSASGATNVRFESIILEGGHREPIIPQAKGVNYEDSADNITLYCGENCDEPDNSRNYTVSEAEETLAFETVYTNGTRTLTRLRLQEQMVDYINAWMHNGRTKRRKATAGGVKSRKRRAVFEIDSRFEVNVMKYLTAYPFSAAVKLSTGCTGVLIAPQHVLTAAHCLHNGRRYTVNVKQIRAGFRRERERTPGEDPDEAFERSFIWIRAEKAYLPYDWTNAKAGLLPLDRDYAVILLKRSPERDHLDVGMGDLGSVPSGTMVHFSSFDLADQPTMFYRFCTVTGGTQELFYQHCDGEPPSIGAGVYVRQWDPEAAGWSRKVIGLFGGYTSFLNSAGLWEAQNVAMRITPLKFAQICYWVTGDYGACKG